MSRWTFTDLTTSEVYTFERNPREMTSPHLPQGTVALPMTVDTRNRATRSLPTPTEWSFTGDIRTEAQHEALRTWAKRTSFVKVTDHLGRQWKVQLVQFDVAEQRPTARQAWRFTYRMRTLLFGRMP